MLKVKPTLLGPRRKNCTNIVRVVASTFDNHAFDSKLLELNNQFTQYFSTCFKPMGPMIHVADQNKRFDRKIEQEVDEIFFDCNA